MTTPHKLLNLISNDISLAGLSSHLTFGNKMKLILTLIASIPLLAFGGESYFFTISGEPTGQLIKGERLQLELPIRKIDPPEASSISAFHQGLGPGRKYQIQVHLKESPLKGWVPMLKLDEEIIINGITVARPADPKFASSFSLEADDPKKIERWCQLLAELLKIPKDHIEIDLTKATVHE